MIVGAFKMNILPLRNDLLGMIKIQLNSHILLLIEIVPQPPVVLRYRQLLVEQAVIPTFVVVCLHMHQVVFIAYCILLYMHC